jgi:hypothetical protein
MKTNAQWRACSCCWFLGIGMTKASCLSAVSVGQRLPLFRASLATPTALVTVVFFTSLPEICDQKIE